MLCQNPNSTRAFPVSRRARRHSISTDTLQEMRSSQLFSTMIQKVAMEEMKSSGCCSKSLGELREILEEGGDPLQPFYSFLGSDILPTFTDACGIEFDRYELPGSWCQAQKQSHRMRRGSGSGGYNTVNHRFRQIVGDEKLPDSRRVALVFHGSYERNIKNILEHGLDPDRRSGQVYGPGEYFAIDPQIGVEYCKGGKAMVVFLVLMPPEKNGQTIGWYPNVVVIQEPKHQFPIGVMRFKSAKAE